MERFTVPLFFVAFIAGLAAMPQNVYAFNQRGIGVDHGAPWRNRLCAAVDSVSSAMGGLRARLTHLLRGERGEVATDLLLPVPTSIGARLRSLKQEKASLVQEMTDLQSKIAVENRTWTAEELAIDDKIAKRVETINTEIARFERLTESDRRVAVTDTSASGPTPGGIKNLGEFLQAVACAASPVIA